ncbi:MAG TPA: carcinine hydrolase/isopenicillin-N N-acyltransferase family protein [Gammaproteobacteria bacterium]|nr:carcinine hydrolase/isopenicillin-N N-acyltransferase family protein [Gammaproteobacteria bacterium]
MFDRSSSYTKARQFVHLHPFYSALGTVAGPATAFFLGWEFLPLSLLSLNLAKELWHEFKHIKDPAHQVESLHQDTEIKKGNLIIGALRHHHKMPIVELYARDSHLREEALAALLARHYLDFYTEYFWYLFAIARVVHGPRTKDTIQFINEEIRRRDLNFDSDTIRLHYILKKINEALAIHNAKSPFYLQRPPVTMDHLRAIIAFCEVEKGLGAAGCSTSVMVDNQGVESAVRNLDWFRLFSFFNYLIAILKLTQHASGTGKPEATFSLTIEPGILEAITAFNESLEAAYNEAGGKENNLEYPGRAYPGLSLVQAITENCQTMDEVVSFLKEHPPASQHNLTITSLTGHGIIQSMASRTEAFQVRGRDLPFAVATNHFLNKKNEPMKQSACVPCSTRRFDKIYSATEEKLDLAKIAESSATCDTVQSILSRYADGDKKIWIKTATGNAPTAPDHKGNTDYIPIDLDDLFRSFKIKAEEVNKALAQADQENFSEERAVDDSLINLMNKSDEVSKRYPKLARELSEFYSALNEQLARLENNFSEKLSRDVIKKIADDTVSVVDAILLNKKNRVLKFLQYENLLDNNIRKMGISYDKTKMLDALFAAFMCVALDVMARYLTETNSSMGFSLFAVDKFLSGVLQTICRGGIGLVAGVSVAAFSVFKKTQLVSSAENVLGALNEVYLARPGALSR